MNFDDYVRRDALGLAALVASGEVSAGELLECAIARAEAVNPRINAIVRPLYDYARRTVSGPLSGPFAGVPFLLKDLMADFAGEPTSGGSRFFTGYVPKSDSELVKRYKAAGLVIFGKTNTPELGLTPFTEPSLYGPTRNPWNLERTPGGSSGGSAAAVAAGIVPMANGGDGGGSIRIPASCNGLVGLKPTRGRIPEGPDRGDSWWGFTSEHVLARSVRDTAAALDASTGADPGCPYFTAPPAAGFLAALREPVGPLRIAFIDQPLLGRSMHSECRLGLQSTVGLLESLGHTLVEAGPPVPREAFLHNFAILLAADVAATLTLAAEQCGSPLKTGDVEPGTLGFLRIGQAISGEAVARARFFFGSFARQLGRWFEDYDVLLTPTLGRPPFRIGALQPDFGERVQMALLNRLPIAGMVARGELLVKFGEKTFDWIPNTPVFNVSGQPSISLPLHWSSDGLPVGMMFTARFADDARLLQLAAQLEQARPWFARRPAL